VAHVDVYVVRVDATTNPDTTVQDSGWVTVAAPHKVFDLLTVQQGITTLVGSSDLSSGQYKALRVVINADSSSILWSGNVPAVVNWQNWGKPEVTLYALVESPVSVPDEGADIVIDFDVGRSFLYNYFGTKTFVLIPWIRAVNAAATGTLEGTVTSDLYGPVQPLPNANVTAYQGNPILSIDTWSLVATGHTDASGAYRIAYLRPGTYIVRVEEPIIPALVPATRTGVAITTGDTTHVSVTLSNGGGSGSVSINGPQSVGVGGVMALEAWVRDSSGNYVLTPAVTWTVALAPDSTRYLSVDSTATYDSSAAAFLTGRYAGWTSVTATSGAFSASYPVQVLAPPGAVASVKVQPAGDTLSVGDSAVFIAVVKDSLGQTISNVPISWSISDTLVVRGIDAAYQYATVRARSPGTATLQAIAQGKVGQATILVH
jgi:uncharacterized protein DUF4382/carboxypeptidase family protein